MVGNGGERGVDEAADDVTAVLGAGVGQRDEDQRTREHGGHHLDAEYVF